MPGDVEGNWYSKGTKESLWGDVNHENATAKRTPVFTTAADGVAVLVVVALVVFAPEIALPALAFGLL